MLRRRRVDGLNVSERDRRRWEEKHARNQCAPLASPLNSMRWLPRARPGALALDLACGRGRHTLSLLDAGYCVVAVDVARSALVDLRQRHADDLARCHVAQVDLDQWPFAERGIDLVLQCDYLDRRLFPAIKQSTRPGGHVLIDTFGPGSGNGFGPNNPEYRLSSGELERVFSDWKILRVDGDGPRARRCAILAQCP